MGNPFAGEQAESAVPSNHKNLPISEIKQIMNHKSVLNVPLKWFYQQDCFCFLVCLLD